MASKLTPAQVLGESLAWMARAVEEFGLPQLDVRLLLEWLKADLASTNAGVRNAATALAGVCHRQLGPGLAGQLREHVKPALMAALEDTFAANPQQAVWPCPDRPLCCDIAGATAYAKEHARRKPLWYMQLQPLTLCRGMRCKTQGARAGGADSSGAPRRRARGARPSTRTAGRRERCRRGAGARSGEHGRPAAARGPGCGCHAARAVQPVQARPPLLLMALPCPLVRLA